MLLLLASAAMLASPLPGKSAEWRQVAERDALLVLYAPGLPHTPTKTEQKTEGWQIFEFSQWNAVGGGYPRAQLFLQRYKSIAPKTLVYVRSGPIGELIGIWFKDERVTLGTEGTSTNEIGELEYQRFTRAQNVPCIFFGQFADTFADSRGYTRRTFKLAEGNIAISGWYCVNPETSDLGPVFDAFLQGVGLKGFAVPRKPEPTQSPVQSSSSGESQIQRVFAEYRALGDQALFKVFVVGDSDKWGWARRNVYEEAVRSAMDECAATGAASCRLFAVGSQVVDGLDEEKKNQMISAYLSSRINVPSFARDIIPRELFAQYRQLSDFSSYKVMFSSLDGIFAWKNQISYEVALQDAKTRCEANAMQRKCELYAVGDTVVWDLSENHKKEVVAEYAPDVSNRDVRDLSLSGRRAFVKYLSEKAAWGFKAFAAADNGAWAWRQRSTVEGTIDDAILSCRAYASGSSCKIFALGDVIVWKMSPQELENVMRQLAVKK